jgi:hypothetical protein
MKFVLLLILTPFIEVVPTNLEKARMVFEQAEKNEKQTLVFLRQILHEKNNVLIGYKGALTMVMAKHALSPIKKLSYFNEGKLLLEQAIKQDPTNAELVFLRFSIQCNSPSFLLYNQELYADKALLLREVRCVKDADLKRRIILFLLHSNEVNEQEKLNLRKQI